MGSTATRKELGLADAADLDESPPAAAPAPSTTPDATDASRLERLYRRVGTSPLGRRDGSFGYRLRRAVVLPARLAFERLARAAAMPDLAAALARWKTLIWVAAPIVAVLVVIRAVSWVAGNRRQAWLRGKSWPSESTGIMLFGLRPRR